MAGAGFNGLTVAAFESRMAAEMTRLIERHGGKPLVAPALREIPLEDNSAALQFGELLLTEGLDVLVLLTGAGTTTLFEKEYTSIFKRSKIMTYKINKI